MSKFNLTAYSSIEYCIFGETKVPIDIFDIIFAVCLITGAVIITMSSLFDRYLRNINSKKTADSKEHYKKVPKNKSSCLATKFLNRLKSQFYIYSLSIFDYILDAKKLVYIIL